MVVGTSVSTAAAGTLRSSRPSSCKKKAKMGGRGGRGVGQEFCGALL